jgi:acyl carrier protein
MTTQQTTRDSTGLHREVRRLIADELEVEPAELTDTGNFLEEYDADSLTLITVAARIESELGVTVPDTEWSKMVNLASALDVIDAYAAAEPENA